MTTPLQIITAALQEAGVLGTGQTALAEDTTKGLVRLNWMLSQWNQKRWLVFRELTLSVTSTGAQSYTIGPGGNINTTGMLPQRPSKIQSAFARQLVNTTPNQVDYPLEILTSREDYNRISVKQLTAFPQFLWYDNAMPLGVLYPWPVMQTSIYSLHVSVMAALSEVTVAQINTDFTIPGEYMAAMHYELARRLRMTYRMPPDPNLDGAAKEALQVLRKANLQIPLLQMPQELVRPGLYNVYSDQMY